MRSRFLVVLALAASTGCGKTYEATLKGPERESFIPPLTADSVQEQKRDPLKVPAYDGVLKGRVTFKGSPPPAKVIPAALENPQCKLASGKFEIDKFEKGWIINDGGVKNVVVFLAPPEGAFFPIVKDEDKTRTEEAYVDQPFCAFHPQVLAHYPYFIDLDGKTKKPTGEKFVIYNRGNILHNASLRGDQEFGNPSMNQNVPPGSKFSVDLSSQPSPVSLSCSVHPWMNAAVWVFDHPYAAVSDDNGNFVVRNIPTGVDVQLVVWHQKKGFFRVGGEKGEKRRFKSGENPFDFSISE